MKRTLLPLLTAAIALSACTQQTSYGKLSITGSNVALVMKPDDTTTELAQLQRYRGQTAFLDRESYWPGRANREMPAPGGGAPKAPDRAEQESDVFKVGVPGSKLLYLMNQYRGLQVVSFAKGEEQPELLGRAATSGNSVDEMYSDLKNSRLIAIEHDYKYADGKDQSHSMLVVYDVSQPSQPARSHTIDIEGLVMDSRIVGDVLYVASRADDKGLVTSYSLTSPDLHQVEQHALTLPVAYGENMNIIQQDAKAYLVAVLADKGWGWWQNASTIEVVDISNPQGRIQPMMSVATRGFVRERSQTTIRNNTLVVTSNYASKEAVQGRDQIFRIAVETFKFPEATSEVLTDDEAQFRKLNIQRQLEKVYGADRDQLEDKLMNDKELGLKGRFVKKGETLKKIVADSMVTVGDGSGLSAQLQDVRYQDGLLYAFWVPRDQIDPFDLFDMSQPENGITYLGRLHFDGWIERAIPFNFNGRKFVLGLGWIQPVVDNEDGRRVPQAMIFEVKQVGSKLKAVDVAQISLEGANVWTNFNGQDKMVEVRETASGQGEILFAAEKFAKNTYSGGGQIIRFDLSKVDTGDALAQGPFLSGGAEWIRRVFTNPEINRINSFSDHALATFGGATKNGDMHPVNILELARNITAYEVIQGAGTQIITNGYGADATTSLRSVSHVDDEKSQALSQLEIAGSYSGRLMLANGDLLIATTKYDYSASQSTVTTRVTRITAMNSQLSEVAHQEWQTTYSNDDISIEMSPLVQLADGTILAQVSSTIKRLDLTKGLTASPLALDPSCVTTDRQGFALKVINGSTFMTSEQSIDSKDFENERFVRRFLSPVALTANSISCSATYNIPGDVKTVNANGDILVENMWVTDLHDRKAELQHSLLSLHLANGVATLKDEATLPQAPQSYMPRMIGMCRGGCGYNPTADFRAIGAQLFTVNVAGSNGHLEMYQAGADSMIEHEMRSFDTSFDEDSVSISGLIVNGDETLAVLRGDRKVQVMRWTSKDLRPQAVKIKLSGTTDEASESVTVPGAWWSMDDLHYSAAPRTLEIAQGWNGMTQLLLMK